MAALPCAVVFGVGAQAQTRAALDTEPAASDANGGEHSTGACARLLGIECGAIYTGEVLANMSGGLRRGAIYDGKLETFVKADLAKSIGWAGLTFYANSFQLHGSGRLRRDYVGNLVTISNIEALQTTRLSELWLEQSLLNGALSVRIGQLAADTEFFFSRYGAHFVNSDWPTIASSNLPSGGPAYPLSTPGVRLKIEPTKDMAFLLAVFNGDPAGPGQGDEQERNRFGLNFRIQDPAFVMAELQYSSNQDKSSTGLASALKLGAWAHFGRFDDQRFDLYGISLASPLSSGSPFRHRGNGGVYGIVDQQLYRPPGGDASSGLVVYTRISASPSDRNLIESYFEGGTIASGLVPGRPDDRFGVAVIHARISAAASALDRDAALLTGLSQPIRDHETTVELSYQAQLRSNWTIQPLFQHVWHPSGSAAIPDATVLGIRTVITY